MSNTHEPIAMFTFSTYLWYNKNPKAISKKTGEVSVYLRVYIGTKGLQEVEQFKLDIKWPPHLIDTDASKLLSRRPKDPDVNDYNIIIMMERAKFNEIAKIYRLSETIPTMELFRRDTRMFDYNHSLVTYMDKRRTERHRKGEIDYGTWKNVGSTIYSLLEYQPEVRFEHINYQWMADFKTWLRKSGLAPGTIWTKIKDVKTYLALAQKERTISVNTEAVKFPNTPPAPTTVYLNRAELRALMDILDPQYLSPTEYTVLRAFLFTCFTSLRISDLYAAGNEMLVSANMLTFIARKNKNKTPKKIDIPLVPLAKNLIDESLRNFFDLPTEQEYNRTLKDLAHKAGINKKLTSHVGRHTFGYLYMTTVGNLFALREILGHSDIVTTERYAHLDEEYKMEQALLMQKGFEKVAQNPRLRSRETI